MDPKKRLCVVPVCQNLHFSLVHRFPAREDRAEMWRTALNVDKIKELSIQDIRKRYFVCSRHFLRTDYKNAEARSLNWNAVPSINLVAMDSDCIDSCVIAEAAAAPLPLPPSTPKEPSPLRRAKKSFTLVPVINLSEMDFSTKKPSPTALPPTPEQPTARRAKKSFASPMVGRGKSAEKRLQPQSVVPLAQLTKVVKAKVKGEKQSQKMAVRASHLSSLLKSIAKEASIAKANPAPKPHHDLRISIPDAEEFDKDEEIPEEYESDRTVSDLEAEMAPQLSSLQGEDSLQVPGLNVNLDFFWLRDHCRCAQCYNQDTNQRKLDIRKIPLNIRPLSTKVNGDQLRVEWPEGHLSSYSIESLSKMLLRHRLANKPKAFTWTRDTIQRFSYARVAMNDYLQDDQVSRSVVQSLIDYGVAFVEKVPANATFTQIVINRLFRIHRTHFGEMWTFTDSHSGYLDTAYTSEFLPAHTDNTYFNDASGLQVLHCIEYNASGGETLLVDGFKVLENLKAKHPDAYERLKDYNVPAENRDKDAHHTHTAPMIIEDPVDGTFQQIRYNILDRAPFDSLHMSEMRQFYEDLRKLSDEVENPENEWWFSLKPGTVMLFDNWRLLHGRKEYKGKRVMSGSYVSRTEFMSVARMMNIVP